MKKKTPLTRDYFMGNRVVTSRRQKGSSEKGWIKNPAKKKGGCPLRRRKGEQNLFPQ